MTINNIKQFMSSLWDWACLDGCFGDTNIRITDVDGLVERNGMYLLLEAKSPGVQIKKGQAIMYERLARLRCFTVLIVWGKANQPERIQVTSYKSSRTIENASIESLRGVVKEWYEWANSQTYVEEEGRI